MSEMWNWRVKPEAKDGRLVVTVLSDPADYFIGDRAKGPFPLKPKEELWVEVTVPPTGPPQPIQLAISSDAGFNPLVIR